MPDEPAPATVRLSRPLGTETSRHPPFQRDSAETVDETSDLKALARLVLARDTRRDGSRDKASCANHVAKTRGDTVETASALRQAIGNAVARWGEAGEERAAIVQHDGGIPREWAEGFGRLDPDRPPKGVSPKRWLQFINDIGQFLDSPFCAVAAALGWTAFDLFGADRDRPFARIDHAGLLWLLNGNRLAMLAENTATIETRTRARQTYRLKPSAPGRVLAWELVDAEPL